MNFFLMNFLKKTAGVGLTTLSSIRAVLLCALTVLPIFAWSAEQAGPHSSPEAETQTLPVLTDFNGTPRTIDEFAGNGKWLVVMIWASDCHVCNTEIPEYMAFHEAHKDKDASVLGISMDGASRMQEARDFIDRHLVNFQNLIAEPEAVTELYAKLAGAFLAGTPAFMVYAPDGKIAAKQVGAVPVKIIEEFMETNAGPVAGKG